MGTNVKSAVAAAACLLFVSETPAQPAPKPYDALLGAKSLKCRFEASVTGEWKGKALTIEKSGPPFREPIHFDSISARAGTARMIGNIASEDVRVIATGAGLNFFEVTGAGNLVVTTVFASYRKLGTGEFYAVMSRHMGAMDEPLPSQAYGTCVIF